MLLLGKLQHWKSTDLLVPLPTVETTARTVVGEEGIWGGVVEGFTVVENVGYGLVRVFGDVE